LVAEDAGTQAAPFAAAAGLTSAAEPKPERGGSAFLQWIRPIDSYVRYATRVFDCARYG
jgi:hypothetical protein